jgi:hypothetical protein
MLFSKWYDYQQGKLDLHPKALKQLYLNYVRKSAHYKEAQINEL